MGQRGARTHHLLDERSTSELHPLHDISHDSNIMYLNVQFLLEMMTIVGSYLHTRIPILWRWKSRMLIWTTAHPAGTRITSLLKMVCHRI